MNHQAQQCNESLVPKVRTFGVDERTNYKSIKELRFENQPYYISNLELSVTMWAFPASCAVLPLQVAQQVLLQEKGFTRKRIHNCKKIRHPKVHSKTRHCSQHFHWECLCNAILMNVSVTFVSMFVVLQRKHMNWLARWWILMCEFRA